MKKLLLSFSLGVILLLSLINFTYAVEICIDHDAPSPPLSLSVTSSGNDLILNWPEATDEPSCSGVDYYVITKNGINLKNTTLLTYTDTNVPYGTYNYTVYAVDKVGHNSGPAIKIEIKTEPSSPGGGGPSGGGPSGGTRVVGGEAENSYICEENWQCDDWGSCENGEQTRTCIDTNACGTSIEKPAITQGCEKEETSSTNFLTGAVTGITNFASSPTGIASIIGVITVAGAIAFVSLKKKFVKKTENSENKGAKPNA